MNYNHNIQQAAIHEVANQDRIEEVRKFQEQQEEKARRQKLDADLAAESRRRADENSQRR